MPSPSDHPALERYEQVLTTEGFHSINQAVFLADGMRDEYEARIKALAGRQVVNERELLYELFIPALRYYLPRRSACAMTFPRVCKAIWPSLNGRERAIALRDIEEELDDGNMWSTERAAWREFVKWAEQGGEDE